MTEPIGDLVKRDDYSGIAKALESRFETAVDAEQLEASCKRTPFDDRSYCLERCEESWLMWLKNRLREIGSLPGAQGQGQPEIHLHVVMHVFFINDVIETPEMLAILHNEQLTEEQKQRVFQVARSKLFGDSPIHFHQPIDATAWRVS